MYNTYMKLESLTNLGLSEKEIAIYICVLQNGKITASNVSFKTKINRTTVYSVARELVQKGLITEDLGGATSYLVAKPAKELNSMVEKEEKAIQEKKKLAELAIKELQALTQNVKYSIPKITFIQEDGIENYLYKQTPIWDESLINLDKTWWGFQDKTFVKYYEDWIDWYWETGGKKDTELKLLSNESAESIKTKKFHRRQIKFWDGSQDFSATTWVNGDFLITIVTHERPHYLIEIHDSTLSQNMREIFKKIWQDTN